MDKLTYKKLFSQAIAYALKRGNSWEQAEDFAQRFILARYVVRNDQKINEAYIDYLRHEYGNLRHSGLKNKSIKNTYELNEDIIGDSLDTDLIFLKIEAQRKLTGKEIKILAMRLKGEKLIDIAKHLGLTMGRIHQKIEQIKKKLS